MDEEESKQDPQSQAPNQFKPIQPSDLDKKVQEAQQAQRRALELQMKDKDTDHEKIHEEFVRF